MSQWLLYSSPHWSCLPLWSHIGGNSFCSYSFSWNRERIVLFVSPHPQLCSFYFAVFFFFNIFSIDTSLTIHTWPSFPSTSVLFAILVPTACLYSMALHLLRFLLLSVLTALLTYGHFNLPIGFLGWILLTFHLSSCLLFLIKVFLLSPSCYISKNLEFLFPL